MTIPARIEAIARDLRQEPSHLAPPAPLAATMGQRAIPGVGLAVVVGGELEWAAGFGVRHSDRPEPVTADTLFQAGSISKPVAAVCALRLVAQGALGLDADVNERLTSWRVTAAGGWKPRVTLRQLLSHTAGLTVHGFPGYGRRRPVPDLVDVLEGRGNTPPVRVRSIPGFQFDYSGGGYCVLQQLLVDVTGESFPELARRLVLAPVGMERSGYEQPLPERRHAEAAAGHRTGGRPVDGDWHVYPEMAAAGLWTTPADLARFVVGVQRSQRGAADAILPGPLVSELLTAQAANVPMGLGLIVEGEAASRRFRHGGDDQGFVAGMVGYVDGGLGAVVMVNSDDGYPVVEQLLEAVAREYGWPGYPGTEATEPEVASPVDPDLLVGAFQSESGYRFVIERAGAGIALVVPGQARIELRPVGDAEWRAADLAATLTFEPGPDGRATSVRLHQESHYGVDVDAVRAD